jgi:hypothetical protein
VDESLESVRNTEKAPKPKSWLLLGKVATHCWENVVGEKTAREAVATRELLKLLRRTLSNGERVVKL